MGNGGLLLWNDWITAEQRRLALRYPRLATASRRFVSSLWLTTVPLAVVAALIAQRAFVGPGSDASVFTTAAHRLLSAEWQSVFADRSLQIGPLYLALTAIGSWISDLFHVPFWAGPSAVSAAACALVGLGAVRALLRETTDAHARRSVYGGFAITNALIALPLGATFAHPEDLLCGYLLMWAAAESRSYRGGRAGLIFGIALGVKLWTIVAVGVLLLGGLRQAVRGAVVAGALGGAVFAPFIVGGHFSTFRFAWQVEQPAPLTWLLPTGFNFPYELRLLQVLVCASAGMLVAFSARSKSAVWLLPAAVISLRMLLDPRWLLYYWAPLLGSITVGLWTATRTPWASRALAASVLGPIALLLLLVPTGTAQRIASTALCAAVPAYCFYTWRRPESSIAAGPVGA